MGEFYCIIGIVELVFRNGRGDADGFLVMQGVAAEVVKLVSLSCRLVNNFLYVSIQSSSLRETANAMLDVSLLGKSFVETSTELRCCQVSVKHRLNDGSKLTQLSTWLWTYLPYRGCNS